MRLLNAVEAIHRAQRSWSGRYSDVGISNSEGIVLLWLLSPVGGYRGTPSLFAFGHPASQFGPTFHEP